jgi:hypothetical protein
LNTSNGDLEREVRKDSAAWRAYAFAAFARIRDELQQLRTPGTPAGAVQAAEQALDEALRAMVPGARGVSFYARGWVALELFYAGTRIEQTWRAIHRAQACLYMLYPEAELKVQAERLEGLVAELPEQAALLKSLTTLVSQLSQAPTGGAPRPQNPGATLRGIYERAMDVSDNLQREARALRNSLMAASAAIFFVFAALGVAHALDTNILRLCEQVKAHQACPLGGAGHPFDVFAVGLAGMLGGLLSIVIPLATGERVKTPYRIFNQQLVLKTLAGAVSAIGGVLLIEGGLITSIKLESTTAILGYALFFGFAQQVVTGAVDRRADSLARQTPAAKSA